jgi:surface antigen
MRSLALHMYLAAAVTLTLGLASGCQTMANAPKTTIGTVGGAAAGGLLGAAIGGNTKSIAAGAVAGGLLGALGGNVLDQRDRRLAAETAQRAFEAAPTGNAVQWTNPDTGNYGTVTPTRTYQSDSGTYCREFQQEIVVGGQKQQGFGTACRMLDGTWQIQG